MKDESTQHESGEQGTLSPLEQMLKRVGAKEVPHPGTVRVTIFPNPRERKVIKPED